MHDYNVGQVLFLVNNKDQRVIPVQIVEEVCRKNLEGSSVDYLVKIPGPTDKKINLKSVDAKVYKNTKLLRESMFESAQTIIEKIVKKAEVTATDAFQWGSESLASQILDKTSQLKNMKQEDDNVLSLEDGTKVHLPPELHGVMEK